MDHLAYPITQFLPQTKIVISKIECSAPMKEKLLSMGIAEGSEVEILHVSKKNALVLVKRHNRRIALRCITNLAIYAKQI